MSHNSCSFVDINECIDPAASGCTSNQTCKNSVGSFTCDCKSGYKFSPSAGKCLGKILFYMLNNTTKSSFTPLHMDAPDFFLIELLTPTDMQTLIRCFKIYLCNHGSHMDWKTWKNKKISSSQGNLNSLEKLGNFTQNTGKMKKFYPKC